MNIAALSGGKDSTAMALLLKEQGVEFDAICTPTGNELPEMQAHWGKLETVLGKPLIYLSTGLDLFGVIRQQKMIPNFRARFCTRILKIEPAIEYMKSLSEDSALFVGLRADEEDRPGLFDELVNVRYPLREAGMDLADVRAFLADREITIPARTDCALCYYQRIGEWWKLWKFYPDEYQKGVEIEAEIGHTFRSASRDTWSAALKDLRAEFENARVPRGIDVNNSLFDEQCGACRVCSM